MFKSWVQFGDTMFLIIFGYNFISLIPNLFVIGLSDIFNFSFLSSNVVTVLGFAFGVWRLIDYGTKRKYNKRIMENELKASQMKIDREERLAKIQENERVIKQMSNENR